MPGLDGFIADYGLPALLVAVAGMGAGGFAKGVVGFALPLIALSVAGAVLPYGVAVALLIVPTLVSNLVQSLRQGRAAAWDTFLRFWRMNLGLALAIGASAQLVVALPDRLLFGGIGVCVTLFGLTQLAGLRPTLPTEGNRGLVETAVAVVGGFFGGLSGVWGPPLIMYLLALNLPKDEMMRAQSLSFLLGSLALLAAHLHSGVLNAVTLPASAWLTVPTMIGMFIGYGIHDRLDQERFRRATLLVLVLTGLNLLRRAF